MAAASKFSEQTKARKKRKHKKSTPSSNVHDDGCNFMSDDEPNTHGENENCMTSNIHENVQLKEKRRKKTKRKKKDPEISIVDYDDEPNTHGEDENCITSDIHEYVQLKEKKKKTKRKKKDQELRSDVDYEQERSSVSDIQQSSSAMEAEQTDLQSSEVEMNHEVFDDDLTNVLVTGKIITSAFGRKVLNRRSTDLSAEAILQRRQILVTPEKDAIIHPYNINSVNFEMKHVKILEENGIFLRQGKWTKEEDDHLCKNLQEYLNANTQYTKHEVLCAEDFTEKTQIQKFLRQTGFYKKLAFRLNRMIYACYRRARLLNTDVGMKGEFSEDEISELIRLIQLHGNKWKKIAELLGRSPQNVIDKVKNLEGCVKGPWSEAETTLLQNSIESVVKQNHLDINDTNLPWALIALHVPSRNGNQCRYHWLVTQGKTVMTQESNKWSFEQDRVLLNSLREQNLENENEINWKLIQNSLEESFSIMFLKQKWNNHKKTIHGYKELSFNELLEIL
ncbi:hypothetical protein CHS0354_012378 [Potamilus streckersoni]|uniref:Uncharacterized protein n=1 Tax=Potamilus streckersoni TaxID=2493646 RepID=A0AAE0VXX2_9BIVA|nr:hypothetical protein CHS0354_012378 [Potamilus streckersoni]